MQFLAARSRWTNFLLARYSIPLATCSPKPIRSFTVGFWEHNNPSYQTGFMLHAPFSFRIFLISLFLPPLPQHCREQMMTSFSFLCQIWLSLTYMCLVTDEVAQVTVLHVGQDHEWRPLWRQTDAQQRQNIWVTEVLHDDPLLQELGHLL